MTLLRRKLLDNGFRSHAVMKSAIASSRATPEPRNDINTAGELTSDWTFGKVSCEAAVLFSLRAAVGHLRQRRVASQLATPSLIGRRVEALPDSAVVILIAAS